MINNYTFACWVNVEDIWVSNQNQHISYLVVECSEVCQTVINGLYRSHCQRKQLMIHIQVVSS